MEVTGTQAQPRPAAPLASDAASATEAPLASDAALGSPATTSRPDLTVDDLVGKARAGDREAFSDLVVRFQDVVYNIIHQRLGDADASLDAAQETFVNAYSGIATFRGEASFKSWLLAISLREAENQRRKKRRQLPAGALNGQDPPARQPSPGTAPRGDDDAALVRRALREADEDDAQLILLRDVENLSYLEIAEALGVPIGTVKSGLSRARARLRTALEAPLVPLDSGIISSSMSRPPSGVAEARKTGEDH